MDKIPRFNQLPLDKSHPEHSAWIWGPDDQLGTLNFLTQEAVLAAAKEIKCGVRVGLDWPLHLAYTPEEFRERMKHEIFQIGPNINDCRHEMNTQSGTQWDGLRHWGFDDGRFYNGVTQEEIHSGKSNRNGVHEWCKHGIAGRGVLIDFVAYAKRHNIEYDCTANYAVRLRDVKAIAQECKIQFKSGDILLMRTGYTERLGSMTETELAKHQTREHPWNVRCPGIENTLEVLEWLWDTQFAAVGGDNPGFECFPPTEYRIHQTLLAGFGMPLGELFDFGELSQQCKKEKRWTFFFTSQPLNIVGSVASPPNALAIL